MNSIQTLLIHTTGNYHQKASFVVRLLNQITPALGSSNHLSLPSSLPFPLPLRILYILRLNITSLLTLTLTIRSLLPLVNVLNVLFLLIVFIAIIIIIRIPSILPFTSPTPLRTFIRSSPS